MLYRRSSQWSLPDPTPVIWLLAVRLLLRRQAVFVLNAVLGLVWMGLWFSVVYDHPSKHPACQLVERIYIEAALTDEVETAKARAAAAASSDATVSRMVMLHIL
eukprot:SAG31_NODE_212_length_20157_cov_9.648868_2_plen_104_part_00